MSEPVIKPFMVTMERGEDGKIFWREHYTRDDLVFAVALAVATTTGLSQEKSMEIATDAVDRLTKGDV